MWNANYTTLNQKQMRMIFRSIFLLLIFLFFSPSLIAQNENNAIVYFQDGNTVKGTILINRTDNKTIVSLISNSNQDTTILLPKDIISFVIKVDKAKNIQRALISGFKEGYPDTFFERIYRIGKYAVYSPLESGSYFLMHENGGLKTVPKDKTKRKELFKSLMPILPETINERAFSDRLNSLYSFVNFLNSPSLRYPSRYLGMKTSYGLFKVASISSDRNIYSLFPKSSRFTLSQVSAEVYINEIQDKKGRWASYFSVGGQIIKSTKYYDSTDPRVAYSLKGHYGYSCVMANYYLKKGKTFSYLTAGAKVGILLKEESLVVSAINIGDNSIRLEHDPADIFHFFNWSPKFGVGIELPLREQYYLTLESTFESITDANNKRALIPQLSIGINLF